MMLVGPKGNEQNRQYFVLVLLRLTAGNSPVTRVWQGLSHHEVQQSSEIYIPNYPVA
jgi:hypothetical protein